MEELLKTLDIKTILHMRLRFIDNQGNFKEIIIDYPSESCSCDNDK